MSCPIVKKTSTEGAEVFDHSPEVKEISECLLSVHQGQRRATEYALELCTLASKIGWNESALKANVLMESKVTMSEALPYHLPAKKIKVQIKYSDQTVSLPAMIDCRVAAIFINRSMALCLNQPLKTLTNLPHINYVDRAPIGTGTITYSI